MVETVWSASSSFTSAVNETVDAHATSKGAMLESKREATHVLPGKDGLHTGARLCSNPIGISAGDS